MAAGIVKRCRLISDSPRFQALIFGVITLNALVLGLDTYDGIDRDIGGVLQGINDACLAVFVVEVSIRIAAYGKRPQDFFKDPWNVFDFVVVGAAFAPGLRANSTLLRLVRLLRVIRLVSVLPELRVLLAGMGRAVAPIGTMGVMALLFMYAYGMVGVLLYGDQDPARWGNIGEAMLTLFTVLTLEGWNEVLYNAQEIHPQSWIFFVSFVLLASLILINILIAIVINAMEEAREMERQAEIEELTEQAASEGSEVEARVDIARQIQAIKRALEDLERDFGIEAAAGVKRPGASTKLPRVGR